MAIFNSLGSNYNLKYALQALFNTAGKKDKEKLEKYLEEKYGGEVYLTYKGRESLRLSLKIINKPKDYIVGICGFTCYAVYDAVTKEGYKAEYLDIDDSLNFSIDTLSRAIKANPRLKIIAVQNTLGYPCNMDKISRFCRENKIILIEDLAHSIGTKYADGREAGTVGDFTVLSFSQDKMIDAVSGGGLIIRNDKYSLSSFLQKQESKTTFINLPFIQQVRDRFYPIFTWKIRFMYDIVLGKALHLILKKLNLLSKPMWDSRNNSIYNLPNWYCGIIYSQFKNLAENISHRKKIASLYSEVLSKNLISKSLAGRVPLSSNLRFPIFVKNRTSLINYLKQKNIYISDIWYDAPIAPKRFLTLTNYQDQCPNSEKISEEILNLPTHINISKKKARFIAQHINEWYSRNL